MTRAILAAAAVITLVAVTAAAGALRAAPANQSLPTISGSPLVGQSLTADPGGWTGTRNTYKYAWQRCETAASCAVITGASGAKYVVVSGDLGSALRVAVTATNADGEAGQANSALTQVVTTTGGKPANSKPPTITGDAVVGSTLTSQPGTWVGDQPITYAYAWQHCDDAGNACATISGAKKSTYAVPKSYVGKTIRVQVQASNSRGKGSAFSAATAAVQDSGQPSTIVPLPDGGKSIDVKDVPKDERLIVEQVVFSPTTVTSRSTPIKVSIVVKDTRGYFVRNALVFFRSTPVVTQTPTDARTATDGRVVYTVMPESDFPLKNGYHVQFYVKAYREGDPSLGGISGTRLVQVATAS